MDGTPYSRGEWAIKLGVSKPAISQWLTGKTLPRPEHLATIVGVIREDPNISAQAQTRVSELLMAPTEELFEVPPAYLGPTLAHYLIKPVRESVLKLLSGIPPAQQYEFLMEMADRCRAAVASN